MPTTNMTDTAYSHETMCRKEYRRSIAALVRGGAFLQLKFNRAAYRAVEYLNSPVGVIVLAHHDTAAGQIDGIHPVCISDSINRPANIIEPFSRATENAPAYNAHYMTRRSQGGMVLAAFGRMVDGGDESAPKVETENRFMIEVFYSADGPVFGVIDNEADKVHIIRPVLAAVEMQEVA